MDQDYSRVANINLNRLFEDDKRFIAATVNGNPVSARIMIDCHMTANGKIDIN